MSTYASHLKASSCFRSFTRNKKNFELVFEFEDVGFYYEYKTCVGRITLSPRKGRQNLIVNLDKSNDRGWLKRFFFVVKDSLGDNTGLFLKKWVKGSFCSHFLPLPLFIN